MDRIKCTYEVLDLVKLWRDTKHQNTHLRVHNCYTDGGRVFYRVPGFDQRELVARAIGIAEQLQLQGDTTEAGLLSECHGQFEDVDREKLFSSAVGAERSCMFDGIGCHHSQGIYWF